MILDRFKVDGQVAIVTGAGRGIGAATAIALAEAGAKVVISARHTSQLQAVADKIKTARKPGGYSRGAVAFWASGQRRIPDDVAAAWKGPRQRRPRACIEVSPETAARLRERKRAGETWDETLERLLGAQGE